MTLHGNRYSLPAALIGRTVEVRESMKRVRAFDGHRLVAEHARHQPGEQARCTLPEHERDGRHTLRVGPSEPEKLLRAVSPELGELVGRLRKHHGGQALRAVRRLHKMYLDYPTEVLVDAVTEARTFDLFDLGRIEQMVLRRIHGEYFRLAVGDDGDDAPARQLELELEPEPGSEPEPAPGSEPEPAPAPAPAVKPAPERSPTVELEVEPLSDAEPLPDAESRPEPAPELAPEPAPEPQALARGRADQ